MIFKSKFDIGQEVWVITKDNLESVDPCSTCDGVKTINVKDINYKCPRCGGKGTDPHYDTRWFVYTHRYIQRLTLEQLSDNNGDNGSFRYCFFKWGGNVYTEDQLFSTHEEATAAVNQLNEELIKKEATSR